MEMAVENILKFLRMLRIGCATTSFPRSPELIRLSKLNNPVICAAKGPRPRYPRVWKSKKRIGTISKSQKLVECIKGLSNVKEEVYGALDSFVAWELEFPLISVKKALKTLENDKEWKRIVQVIKWMLSKGQGKTMGTYFTLLNALAEDGRFEEAEELWMKIFSENLENMPREFYAKMISIYYSQDMHEKMFEIFADMEELGVKPDSSIVKMVGDVFQKLGMDDKYEKLIKKYPPATWEYRYFRGKRVRIRSKDFKQKAEATVRSTETAEATIQSDETVEAAIQSDEAVEAAIQSDETVEVAIQSEETDEATIQPDERAETTRSRSEDPNQSNEIAEATIPQ
ncbi:hypothetical protein H6P81_000767 [Aristolochia fimbriata]|uniref:Pentatricopeptide repeat-containing protein n=1 Tax=Aristolochia fimbriata TaxID=158543 RepID=A0AAV7F6G3_ARIFI|nr:hypothetical protein H6P81_000767 [Aristolochia fimbriata]